MARFLSSLAVMLVLVGRVLAEEPSKDDLDYFEKHIRPLLVDSCHECHSDKEQKASLRLDSRDALLKGGDSGPALDPGNPDNSLLIEAVNYEGDTQMPPRGKLPDEKIAHLKEWIRRGAPWPAEKPKNSSSSPVEFDLSARKAGQWAFQPLREVSPPEVADPEWNTTAVDRFLREKMDAAGVRPAAPADKRTLIRRVTFDLIGLPPSPRETADFLADASPRAFERVVDRLLDSPHYGERWARHWLDLVRYAETRGHEFDYEIPHAYEYRDYVIRAFNADLPYDQFVIEHLAGDLLPQPRRDPRTGINESIVATGFHFLGEAKHSPVDLLGDEAERIDNQIDVFGKTFLGCTLGCARCHDHKFDAISQKDYYALAGYLQSSRYHVACIDPPEHRQRLIDELQQLRVQKQAALEGALDREVEQGRISEYLRAGLYGLGKSADVKAIADSWKLDPERLSAWVDRLKHSAEDPQDVLHAWTLLRELSSDPESLSASQIADWQSGINRDIERQKERLKESHLFAGFDGDGWDDWITSGDAFGGSPLQPFEVVLDPDAIHPDASRSGLAHSGFLSRKLQGALRSPAFQITHPRIAYRMTGTGVRVRLVLNNLQLIQNPIYGRLEIKLGEIGALKWHVQPVEKWIGHWAYIEILDEGDGYAVLDEVRFLNDESTVTPPHSHLSSLGPARSIEKLAERLEDTLRSRDDSAGNAQTARSLAAAIIPASLVKGAATEWETRAADIAKQIRYERKAVVMIDGTGRDESVFLRGNPRKKGDPVPRRLLEAISGPKQPAPGPGSGRLDLARRVVDPSNPLVARVIVNRVWKHHFGEGIVRTPDDFGNMGQPPSHPELLDYLSSEFLRDGWSLKRLHRRLLLTCAWQMSTVAADPKSNEIDPQNRLWHRMPVRRLEAEAVRDAILAVSGRLDRRLFGPSVLPHLTPFMIGRGRPGQTGPLDGDGRRSLYINVRRNFLTPFFLAFDYPVPFATIGRRSVSNVPAQALALMNNPFVVQQADVWASHIREKLDGTDNRIHAMYESAFNRPPTAEELAFARTFLSVQSTAHGHPDSPQAWTDLAHVLFNTKEFIFLN